MPPTFGGTQRLPRLAGRKRALELLLTGDTFGPERALALVESEQFARMIPTQDLREGLDAWTARRPPAYEGR